MPRGRPRKPLVDLILEDKFRSDRHGEPASVWLPAGAPQMPDWLSEDGRTLWQSLVPALANRGVATAVDAAELGAMCDWWSRYRAASQSLNEVTDLKSTAYYKLSILAGMAWKNFSNAAAKFGLNPSDRARLRIDAGPKQEDELLKFAEE